MFLERILKVLDSVPFIQSIVYFPWDSHKKALSKFFTLWFLVSLPVLLAILLSPIPEGDLSVWEKFFEKLQSSIAISEQFVYAASFLPPVLYLLYERYKDLDVADSSFDEKIKQTFKSLFRGYGWVAIAAVVVMMLTMVTYSAIKVDATGFNKTFLYEFGSSGAFAFYAYALYCWYLMILDGIGGGGNFVRENRESEDELASKFSKRLSEGARE